MNLAVHLPRICTGITLLLLLGTAVCLGGLFFLGLVLLFAALGQWEFYGLFWTGTEKLASRLLAVVLGTGLLAAVWWRPDLVLPAFALAVLTLLILFLVTWAHDADTPFAHTGILGAGLCYVPLLLLPALDFSALEIAFLVGLTAASDTAAYFCGMRFGRHRIWPKVSPKKSVEGSLAGLLACIAFAGVMNAICGKAPMLVVLLVAGGLGIMAQLGDFFESALKRSRNVKDSGKLLPGHGGILDRADSLLFVIPAYATAKAFWIFM